MTESLAAQTADLAAAAHAATARIQPIAGLTWPEGKRVAVNITVDFDAMLLRRLHNEPPMQLAKGEFGGRVGIWRLLELFRSHAIPATVFTPGRICELYPRALRAVVDHGHELADHMWEHRVPRQAELERDHLLKTMAALTSIAGRRPVGSRSHHTRELLREQGFLYNSHGAPRHAPYYVHDDHGQPLLLELPFHFAIDDAMFFSFAWYASGNAEQRLSDCDRVQEMWWTGFLQQYRQGGYFNVCLHPFVSGRALRIAMLDALIARMKGMPGVWFATCEQVARHCLDRFPPRRAPA